ncbi:MAG TPA: type II toxin-antitoxin system RelE/ParE family toxin [Verrucomicrobiae bacterium]
MGSALEFKVIWSARAVSDLEELCNYIAADNPDAAYKTGREIMARAQMLATFPLAGPTYPRGTDGNIREAIQRPYRIFYEVTEATKTVDILHVRHGARQEPKF